MSFDIESRSLRRGTPLSVVLPSANRQAARIGRAEFLLPLISIFPLSRFPPRMMKLSNLPVLRPRGPTCPAAKRHWNECPGRHHSDYRPVHWPTINLSLHYKCPVYRPLDWGV